MRERSARIRIASVTGVWQPGPDVIRLHYSNRTEALLARFVAQVSAEREVRHVLDPVHVVVPNRNMEAYLERGLAEAVGVAANLRFSRLERFMSEWLGRALPDQRVFDRQAYESLVLDVLLDPQRLAQPDLNALRDYVETGPDDDAQDVRRVQLARRLGLLFEAYAFARPELLEAFAAGQLGTDNPEWLPSARFQAALYQQLVAPDAPRPVFAPRAHYVPIGAALKALRRSANVPPPVEVYLSDTAGAGEGRAAHKPSVHVFGVSYVARVFQWLFLALGEVADVDLYVVNPCMEFWEDVPSESELRAARRLPHRGQAHEVISGALGDELLALQQADDPPALVAFGRPGREHVHMLNELTQADFEPCFVDPVASAEREGRAPSVLEALQRDILVRAPVSPAPELPREFIDRSMRFHACASVRREVELVAEEIWAAVRASAGTKTPLRFNDVAVLLPNAAREEYLPHVATVFAEAHAIPHSVVDLDLTSTSRVADACLGLVQLPHTRFTRPEVLALLTHPNLLARSPDVSAQEVRELVQALGIFYGLDQRDMGDTYVDRDLFNWEQGLRRVALGEFMAGPRGADEQPFALDGERYLPESAPAELARGFSLLLRALIADVRFARAEPRPLREWSAFFAGMWEGYIVPTTDSEESELRRCLSVARELVERDVRGTPVSYRVASMLAQEGLEGLSAARGDYLADGVVVSSFLPMRAIPFRQTFVLGLAEGAFPARDSRDTMDLRLERRRVGDVRSSERDKYMFLEVLLSARDAISFSWVARNPFTGEAIPASPALRSLMENLRRSYLSPEEGEALVSQQSAWRHDDVCAGSAFEEALAEARLRTLGDAARSYWRQDSSGALRTEPSAAEVVEALESHVEPELVERVRRDLRTIPAANPGALASARAQSHARAEDDDHEPETLSLSRAQLRRFLEDPLSGWAEAVVGISRSDDEDEDEAVEDEPFEAAPLTQAVTLRRIFFEACTHELESAEVYDAAVQNLQARGLWPVAALARSRRAQDLELLGAWRAAYRGVAQPGERPSRVRLGESIEDGDAERLLPTLKLTLEDPRPGRVGPLEVHLRGRSEALLGQRGSVLLEAGEVPTARREREWRRERNGLRAFLDHVLLTASGETVPAHRAHIFFGSQDAGFVLPALEVEQARAYLRVLVSDLLGRQHAYFAPAAPVLEDLSRWGTRRAEEWREAVLQVQKRSARGPSFATVPHAEEYEVPAADDLLAMYERRFALYAALRTERQVA